MIQGPDFLYFIRDESKTKYYYLDESGNVLTTTTPKPLIFTPDGWQEISIWTERNKKYFGLDRSFTIPLGFVEDGAKILKFLYYTKGVEATCDLLILEQKLFIDDNFYGFYYDLLYVGEPDFSTFTHEGVKVTSNIIEGGLAKLVKANENTTYEIPMEVPEAKKLSFQGPKLLNSATFRVNTEDHDPGLTGYFPLTYINQEGVLRGVIFNVGAIEWEVGPNLPVTSPWFVQAVEDIDITVKGKLNIRVQVNDEFRIQLFKFNRDTGVNSRITIASYSFGARTELTEVSFDHTEHLQAGEYLALLYTFQPGTNFIGNRIFFEGGDMGVSSYTRKGASIIAVLSPLYVFGELVRQITNGRYTVDSTLLTQRDDIWLTCGDALRGLVGSKIKTTLSQFFNSMNCVLNIGMGILNGKLVIEKKEFWFDGDEIDLGESATLRVVPALDFIFNTIRVGYPNQDYDDVNGRDEPNTTQLWSTGITKVVKEFSLVSDYRADSYGMEFLRLNLDGKKTTDSSSDNSTFMIQTSGVSRDGVLQIDRGLNLGATGLIDPEGIFNIGLSPKRLLLTHGWFIRSFLHGLEHTVVKFQTEDKNSEMVAGGIVEKADVLVGDLEAPKFKAVLFEIETKVPENYSELMLANPIRNFTTSYAGVPLKGISMRSGFEPSTNKSQVFQLLAAVDNDLELLIEVYE